MNGPTYIRNPGEIGGQTGSEAFINRFEGREIDNLVLQNMDAVYMGAGQLDGSPGNEPQSGIVVVPLIVLSQARTNEDNEITDPSGANAIAKKSLSRLHDKFRAVDEVNKITYQNEPNTFYWIEYFINADKEVQLAVKVTHPSATTESQPEQFGYLAVAMLTIAGSIPAKNLKKSIVNPNREVSPKWGTADWLQGRGKK